MVLNKLEITAMTAHFKKPLLEKLQQTYIIPNSSTVVGILMNIYGKYISDFVFGYVCHSEGIKEFGVNLLNNIDEFDKLCNRMKYKSIKNRLYHQLLLV